MIEIRPQPGPQETFLSTPADIAGYGGAAGGGKTFALLVDAIRHIGNPGYGAVIFRRTTEDIRKEGALWDSSRELYSAMAKGREQYLDWRFPSGATVSFNGLQYDQDVFNYQGSQICFLAFDEATHFTAKQFWYMVSRNRSTCGVRPVIRLTFNPDPDSWVFHLFGPWVDEEHPHYGAKSGELRWFVREDGEIRWVPEGTPDAKSITFVSANVFDNQILLDLDPGYLANLRALDPEEKERLLHGKWSAIQARGALWKREWIDRDRVQDAPELKRVVVGLDPSASAGPDSDEAGIIVVGKGVDDHFYVLADRSGTYSPDGWAKLAIAAFDRYQASCIVAEKNQGGDMIVRVIEAERKTPIKLVHAKQGKKVRAEPVAKQAEAGRIHHVGKFPALEGQQTRWEPDVSNESPDRLDALVYAVLELGIPVSWAQDPNALQALAS